MRRLYTRVLMTILVLGIANLVACQSSKAPSAGPEAPLVEPPANEPFLFAAVKDNKVTFLFGSPRYESISSTKLPDYVEKAFDRSDMVASWSITARTDLSGFISVVSLSSLKSHLTPEQWKRYQDVVTDEAPVHLSASAACYMYQTFLKFEDQFDRELRTRAKAQQKTEHSLEVNFEAKQIDRICDYKQLAELLDQNPDDIRSGKVSLPFIEAVNAANASQRERWLPEIEHLHNGPKRVFITLNAEHLLGRRGIVNLMRQHGFQLILIDSSKTLKTLLNGTIY